MNARSPSVSSEPSGRNVMFQIWPPTLIERFLQHVNHGLASLRRDRMRGSRGAKKRALMILSLFVRIDGHIIVISALQEFR